MGILVYYSHDFSFVSETRFYFAGFLLFGVFLLGLPDLNFKERTQRQKLTTIFLVLSISTILHFQFEHNFKYFFFGQET
ncbi:MAG: hypothetical protein GPJ54_20875 [Candidatus Heimdallarchaeota archaeon]|nr:hypothetical protein [Candidatus Heimdallarchaeota archaeon]